MYRQVDPEDTGGACLECLLQSPRPFTRNLASAHFASSLVLGIPQIDIRTRVFRLRRIPSGKGHLLLLPRILPVNLVVGLVSTNFRLLLVSVSGILQHLLHHRPEVIPDDARTFGTNAVRDTCRKRSDLYHESQSSRPGFRISIAFATSFLVTTSFLVASFFFIARFIIMTSRRCFLPFITKENVLRS